MVNVPFHNIMHYFKIYVIKNHSSFKIFQTCSTRPIMYTNTQLHRHFGSMADPEVLHFMENIKGSVCNVGSSIGAAIIGQSTRNHIGITNGLYLQGNNETILYFSLVRASHSFSFFARYGTNQLTPKVLLENDINFAPFYQIF